VRHPTSPPSSLLFYLIHPPFTSIVAAPFFPLSPFFFFNDTATTEIYTLSLHDALPICVVFSAPGRLLADDGYLVALIGHAGHERSEEHTSELQSLTNLVCRLLLEKKKKTKIQ